MATLFTFANLDYLESMSMGSQEMINEMIQIFLDQIPEFTNGMKELLAEQKYSELGSLAHKAKSSVAVMGMDELAKVLKTLELTAKNGDSIEDYPKLVQSFLDQIETTEQEMKDYLAKN
ncbi:MAG: Hpt domain-containing protein [Bacteroidetes bacterium]|jgi:HPt (histidine-containing phosphotransfer) domain-containing protein|nr:Hpt domain-containing protein [Bacteroidota bacterium]MBT3749063.1 Hpt domain-containing protein [Bacteroidota bacterium]MBT4400955.1 Hpt domain-containing protein [Bacteroidota bacterium]MBT4408955.1 Hpt domain-containing protein [Bacteroidota bacterium]MBT7095706.1 Hpt domain-containing protein [Bacteroidota bacterium]